MTIEQAKQTIQSSTLPAEIKAQALENLEKYYSQIKRSEGVNNVAYALYQFPWELSEHGKWYWLHIYNRAERGEFDPPAEMTIMTNFCETDEEHQRRIGFYSVDPPAESESVNEIAEKLYQDFIYEWIRHKSTRTEADILAKYLSTKLASLEKRIVELENKKP